MLPFLETKEIKELVDAILSGELDTEALKVMNIVPFLEKDDVERLFDASLAGKLDESPMAFMPFIEQDQLNKIVDAINSGVITNIRLEEVIPFLEED